MAFKIFPFLLSVFILGHVVCDDKCFNDKNQLVRIPAIDKDVYVITLQTKKTCVVLSDGSGFKFDQAEENCNKFVDGSMLSSGNVDALKSIWNTYDLPIGGAWFLEKKEGNCQVLQKSESGLKYKCSDKTGFACQYRFQYNCVWEIRAVVKDDKIVYETAFSQNSDADHSKSCPPKIQPVDCPGASLISWSSSWGACSNTCTKKDGDPPVMHETREVTCNGNKITVYHNKTCHTGNLCPPETTTTKGSNGNDTKGGAESSGGPGNSILQIVLPIVVILFLIVAAIVGFLCYRRKNRAANVTTNQSGNTGAGAGRASTSTEGRKRSPSDQRRSAPSAEANPDRAGHRSRGVDRRKKSPIDRRGSGPSSEAIPDGAEGSSRSAASKKKSPTGVRGKSSPASRGPKRPASGGSAVSHQKAESKKPKDENKNLPPNTDDAGCVYSGAEKRHPSAYKSLTPLNQLR